MHILNSPTSSYKSSSAEYKLKKLYDLCNKMDKRDKQKGKPLLSQVIQKLGGWKMLGNWKNATWDLNAVMQKVQSDFGVPAFYTYEIKLNQNKGGQKVISIGPAGSGRHHASMWSYHRFQRSTAYEKLMMAASKLLVRDASTLSQFTPVKENVTQQLLTQFINDSLPMEKKIIAMAGTRSPEENYMTMSLGTLTTDTNNVIDWTSQLSYLFGNAGLSASTEVQVVNEKYFKGLSEYIQKLPDEDRNRVVHNYIIWRVIEFYMQELSWEYIYASKDVHDFERTTQLPVQQKCLKTSEYFMADALNHLYITKFLSKKNKETAHEISDHMRSVMKSYISESSWMDKETKKYALNKLDKVTFKVGYPDWMADQAKVDDQYSILTLNLSSYFDSLLRLVKLKRTLDQQDLLRRGTRHEEWNDLVYSTEGSYIFSRNELAISAGLLQFPIYDGDQPHTSSFGHLGVVIAYLLDYSVNTWGSYYDINGQRKQDNNGVSVRWWSNSTIDKYNMNQKCTKDVYSSLTQTVLDPNDKKWKTFKVSTNTPYQNYLRTFSLQLAKSSQLALQGYRDWAKKKGVYNRGMIPGLNFREEKMYFLAQAQNLCAVKSSHAFLKAKRGLMLLETIVNAALGQLDAFSQVFKCKRESHMNHAKKCQF
ncbi:endothelin-converting enzyme 1 [Elysia marginata]|uniref:Endothelin-converting enzyme 1 n=1 Tax=Elysia marginata TaxID=1093978 RepID=A0AAV4FIL1_9GAST|nr:endothelin-converting enzyme 1 [Elysia marginata]